MLIPVRSARSCMDMRIQVTPTDLRSKNAKRVQVARMTYLLPPDLPQLPGGLADRSPRALEQELRDAGLSHVVADDDKVRVVADHQGNRHLYCHCTEGTTGPELTITDDLLSFAGILPIDDDVARLVPLMKFVPPPLCLLRGAERVPPASRACTTVAPCARSGTRASFPSCSAAAPLP